VDYCLEKNVVSRYHAKLTKEEDKYYITDLNSTNGTFVNDQILTTYEKKEITQGDRIALANLNFEFITTGTDFFH
jgi:pSer/pThr/pTyr-binding forkhead associated (FHA) protein